MRQRDEAGIYRVIYVTFIKDQVCVLHCFQKKSNKTSKTDVDLANSRLKELLKG